MERLDAYLTKWLHSHDYDLEVKSCEDEFFYSDELSLIGVATHSSATDHFFLEYLYSLGLELDFSNYFIPAFFHELGHYETYDFFEDEDFDDWREMEVSLVGKGKTYEDFLVYFSHPVEKAASEWAVDYINSHPNEIIEMANALNKIFAATAV